MELWDLYDKDRKPLNRTHVRGEAFAEGEYYVSCEIWVRNSKGEFLITKRHPDKKAGNLWEFAGGGTLAGETTTQSAVRELKEETGIQSQESELQLFATYQHKNYFLDLFLLNKDVEISDIVLQPGETIDAKWASEETILQMIDNEEFVYSVSLRFKTYKDSLKK
ncbi:MAG: NUDIX domain-containing protein [Treponema sp.]|nr:NUDIX domain-containing protein [Treponema sp.]